ncbi:MAG: hypothetical protein MZV70_68775 [Desulfobacterales bacterium]|nr:hypothetical protein [Desulfobacterales bacterium]
MDYAEAIAGYEQMDENLRRPFERFVDRHFTEEEVVELGAYLAERYGLEVRSERVELPVKDRGFLFEEGSEVIYEFLELRNAPATHSHSRSGATSRCMAESRRRCSMTASSSWRRPSGSWGLPCRSAGLDWNPF